MFTKPQIIANTTNTIPIITSTSIQLSFVFLLSFVSFISLLYYSIAQLTIFKTFFLSIAVVARPKLQKCHKSKANPKQTQSNPIFRTPNPILSQIMGIYDIFMKTFFCKTNPIYKNERWSMTHQKTLKIPNKANLKNIEMNVTKVLTTDYNRKDT